MAFDGWVGFWKLTCRNGFHSLVFKTAEHLTLFCPSSVLFLLHIMLKR